MQGHAAGISRFQQDRPSLLQEPLIRLTNGKGSNLYCSPSSELVLIWVPNVLRLGLLFSHASYWKDPSKPPTQTKAAQFAILGSNKHVLSQCGPRWEARKTRGLLPSVGSVDGTPSNFRVRRSGLRWYSYSQTWTGLELEDGVPVPSSLSQAKKDVEDNAALR